jgi:uncharacterized protein
MKAYFFDTSALVKRYMLEAGSEWVTAQCERNSVTLSQLTLVEAVVAFCRRARAQNLNQRISESERDHHIKIFRQDVFWQYNIIDVTEPICIRAGNLSRFHKLRAYDAVQLATALIVSEGLETALIFVSSDTDLLSVAKAEGLDIEDPNAY